MNILEIKCHQPGTKGCNCPTTPKILEAEFIFLGVWPGSALAIPWNKFILMELSCVVGSWSYQMHKFKLVNHTEKPKIFFILLPKK